MSITTSMITSLHLPFRHVYKQLNLSNILINILFRLDETLKAMNSGTATESPGYSERKGGMQNLRVLVNPNIKQSAPEVSTLKEQSDGFMFYGFLFLNIRKCLEKITY